MSLHGALGLIMGPLALMGTLGNVLSYLRLAAVGLASAYLAGVANKLATVGPIWMGVLVAVFFHALNLALAVFSPTIQALRLHYVEFFSKFFVGGGRAFRPFGAEAAPHDVPTHRREGGARWRHGLMAIGAGIAVGLAALATGYAQAKIGAAAMARSPRSPS